eukprot:4185043-Prymnesium_polylepis.1
MELLTHNPFTAGSYASPYLPHLFNVPASEEELLSYSEFQPSAVPHPAPSGPESATPLAAGFRNAAQGAAPGLGNSSAAPLAPLPEQRVPGGVAPFGTAGGQESRTQAQLEETASVVLDQMDEVLSLLDPPAQFVHDIHRFGRDCLELGHDGIAAMTELSASIKDSTPPQQSCTDLVCGHSRYHDDPTAQHIA